MSKCTSLRFLTYLVTGVEVKLEQYPAPLLPFLMTTDFLLQQNIKLNLFTIKFMQKFSMVKKKKTLANKIYRLFK